MHQNTLLWGRLQTISGVQVAVIGGWYFLLAGHHCVWAGLLAGLGTFLSYQIHELIKLDIAFRNKIRDEIDEVVPKFFPAHSGKGHGSKIIQRLSAAFAIINWTMVVVSVGFFYFAGCPHLHCH
jgi:hypothetical protein